MSEHRTEHVIDDVETYLAGGMTPGERTAFEAHVAQCGLCGDALAEARESDAELRDLFAAARPSARFEDRIIGALRGQRPARRLVIHPAVRRTALGIAATILLGGLGVVVNSKLDANADSPSGPLSAFEPPRLKVALESELGRVAGREAQRSVAGNPVASAIDQTYSKQLSKDGEINRKLAESRDHAEAAQQSNTFGYFPVVQDAKGEKDVKGGLTLNYFRPSDAISAPAAVAKAGDMNGVTMDRLAVPAITPAGGTVAATSLAAGVSTAGGREEPKAQLGRTDARTGLGAEPNTWTLQTGAQVPPADAPPPAQIPAPAQTPTPTSQPMDGRKVIRNGTMEFEVERFDDALARVTKLVDEQGGFVATVDSDKLPNGKVKGTVALRVPPERLDTLVLTLRGIGDLKTQKIGAEDVTKHYTDLQSQLRAAQAMYDRLLDLIKNGKGQIKDLVEAEKQLGVWEEKIEQLKGEQRYLDNLVTLASLSIEMYEKDIKTPAVASETEQVNMSLETEKVDEAYARARDAVTSAKGRIIAAELKQYDAGQFGATLTAAIPPDAAEAAIARLRQLDGRIAHFARERKQSTPAGTPPSADVLKVQREDVIVALQIYNLANVAPRRTTTVQLAAANVDRAYHQVLDQATAAGGRVVTSALSNAKSDQQVADLDLQLPTAKADAIQDLLRSIGEVMRQDSAENPDTANVTESKRGLHLRIVSTAAVPPREGHTIGLAAGNVPEAFNDILNAVKSADGRILQSDLNEQNPQNVSGTLAFQVPRAGLAAVNAAIGKSTQVLSRTVNRSADVENTIDTRVGMTLTLTSAETQSPRQTQTIQVEVADVERAVDDLTAAANAAGGRRLGTGGVSLDPSGHSTGQVVVDVPLSKLASVLDVVDRAGQRRSRQVSFDSNVVEGPLSRARIDVTFSNSAASLGGQESVWDAVRHALITSANGLRLSLQMIVIGLCFVAPWVLILWFAWRLIRRPRRTAPTTTTVATPAT